MLCKVSNGIIASPNTSYNQTINDGSINPQYYTYDNAKITPTNLFNWAYNILVTLWQTLSFWGKAKIEIYNSNDVVKYNWAEIAVSTWAEISFNNIPMNNGDYIKFYLQRYNSGWAAFSFTTNITSVSKYVSKTINTHKSLPRQLKEIGNKVSGTLYGYHIDKETWYTGE